MDKSSLVASMKPEKILEGWERTDVLQLIHAVDPIRIIEGSIQGACRPSTHIGADAVEAAFNQLISRLVPTLQEHLDTLVGQDFGLEQNAKLSKAITRLLRRLGCALECPHCQERSVLRFSRMKGEHGYFRYEHTPSKRHGGTKAVGPLKLLTSESDNLRRL